MPLQNSNNSKHLQARLPEIYHFEIQVVDRSTINILSSFVKLRRPSSPPNSINYFAEHRLLAVDTVQIETDLQLCAHAN